MNELKFLLDYKNVRISAVENDLEVLGYWRMYDRYKPYNNCSCESCKLSGSNTIRERVQLAMANLLIN